MNEQRLIRLYDKQANMWDRRRKKQTIDTKWRKNLLADVRGQVLEFAVGAGGNFQFYDRDVKVTALDFSPVMIDKAKRAAEEYGIEVEFRVGEASTMEFPAKRFDTVISTLSICAYPDPLSILRKMNDACKPDGHILLLEHGRSPWPVFGWLQDVCDPLQLHLVGCHANRDILDLVRHSPLTIERHETHALGIIHLIWARPN